ncbi:MAG: CDP-alcohol phosphatidyltransferase family protein [bacterium]|nr:CDP-alcohol phosphatidyltransferase family protein [Acidimicrobiia bacterium]MCY4651444.1 CDP-alcohol phosphatidyltransferase family protein [bacterium]
MLDPIGRFLNRCGISPAGLTLFGLGVTIGGAVIISLEYLVVGSLIALAGSAIDGLDGTLARAADRVTKRGAFLDASVDRLGEVACFSGLAVARAGEPRVLMLIVLSVSGALMIPYLRARAEAEGLKGTGGFIGRAERVILFALGLLTGWVEPMLWAMTVLCWVSALHRFSVAYRELK